MYLRWAARQEHTHDETRLGQLLLSQLLTAGLKEARALLSGLSSNDSLGAVKGRGFSVDGISARRDAFSISNSKGEARLLAFDTNLAVCIPRGTGFCLVGELLGDRPRRPTDPREFVGKNLTSES